MTASIRFLCLAGSLALLAACGGGRTDADNLADLDARLTNGTGPDNLAAANDALALAAAGGKIEKAPRAIETKAVSPAGRTLGSLARQQAAGGQVQGGDCARNVKHGLQWAEKMPQPFRLYPGAKLLEAAGIDEARCTLRIISFTAETGIDPIIDYYYTQARRAGYDAEHLVSQGEHQLGGTRAENGAAYVVFARKGADNRTDVDVVANAQ